MKVQYEEMLPHEFEAALAAFPVAYVPVGSLEWHGRHLALGNDALKAHGILVRTAQKYGGVVLPPTYWGHMAPWKPGCHPGLAPETVDRLYTEIYTGLVTAGFRVVIGVTGHDVEPQVASLQQGVDALAAEGKAVGYAMMEGEGITEEPLGGMDHAAHWETSILMALRPELVEMERIAGEDLDTQEGQNAAGIWGRDPRVHASAELGERVIALMVDRIGAKARELLESLTP